MSLELPRQSDKCKNALDISYCLHDEIRHEISLKFFGMQVMSDFPNRPPTAHTSLCFKRAILGATFETQTAHKSRSWEWKEKKFTENKQQTGRKQAARDASPSHRFKTIKLNRVTVDNGN